LSFGGEKVCSGLGGGVLFLNDKRTVDGISNRSLSSPEFAPLLRNFVSTLIFRRWRRWTYPFLPAKATPDALPAPYRTEGMANLNAAVAVSLMQTLGENITARRARVRAYQELLGGDARLELVPHRAGSACLTQVVRFLSKRRGDDPAARVIEASGKQGYEVQGSYLPIHLLPTYERFARGPLRHAESLWSDLIELPCEPDVSLDHIERIAGIVR
jgi:dTDP-4-amino-4,6-dideoxygalactose transaminase